MGPELTNLFELIVALVCAMFAYAQHRRASGAIAETKTAQQTTENVLNFFDQTDDTVTVVPTEVQGRSFKMSPASKDWITSDRRGAESKRLGVYTISVPSVWYNIEYGIPSGSGGSGKGVPK